MALFTFSSRDMHQQCFNYVTKDTQFQNFTFFCSSKNHMDAILFRVCLPKIISTSSNVVGEGRWQSLSFSTGYNSEKYYL